MWAIVGDRTHCIAVKFDARCVERYHRRFASNLTSLKGSLVTLVDIKLTVGAVHTRDEASTHDRGFVYRHLQQAALLEVSAFEVVGCVNEPIWFSKGRVVTNTKGVSGAQLADTQTMITWVKQCIRLRNMARAAKTAQNQARLRSCPDTTTTSIVQDDNSNRFPTPAQRKGAILPTTSTPHTQDRTPHDSIAKPSELSRDNTDADFSVVRTVVHVQDATQDISLSSPAVHFCGTVINTLTPPPSSATPPPPIATTATTTIPAATDVAPSTALPPTLSPPQPHPALPKIKNSKKRRKLAAL